MKRSEEPLICRIKLHHVVIQYFLVIIIGAVLYYNFIDAFIPNSIMVGVICALSIQMLEILIILYIDSYNERRNK
jgi:hypothetical protein